MKQTATASTYSTGPATGPAAVQKRYNGRRMFRTVALLCSFLLCGCGALGHTTPSPELQSILVSVSARYLNAVATGDIRHTAVSVLWSEYEMRGHNRLTRGDVEAVLNQIRERHWSDQENPLYNLKVDEVTIDEDQAAVSYIKKLNSGSEVSIKVRLAWSGNAWLVVDDNLFGDDGYMVRSLRGTI